MQRNEDWPERLIETIGHHGTLPLIYGVSCCLTMPLACVQAMTGELPWADEHGETDEAGARARLAAHGFTSTADAFAALFPEIPVALAQRGDVGVIERPDGVSGVIFVGAAAIGKHADRPGNLRIPRSLVTRAFKVG